MEKREEGRDNRYLELGGGSDYDLSETKNAWDTVAGSVIEMPAEKSHPRGYFLRVPIQ